jgi:hypothetical protein
VFAQINVEQYVVMMDDLIEQAQAGGAESDSAAPAISSDAHEYWVRKMGSVSVRFLP